MVMLPTLPPVAAPMQAPSLLERDLIAWASYWPEVLAVFAVHTNLNSDSDVVVINAAQMQRIQDTFWAMHEITYEVEEVDTTPEPTEDDPDPEQ